MYKEFYGLTAFPFILTADPQFLYLSAAHENCLLYLLHGIEREYGLIVMTGPIGSGKTFLLNTLVQKLGNKTHVAYLVNPKLDPTGILQYASQEFRLEISGKSKAELLINLKNFLLFYPQDKVIIIVDEAHTLSVDVLEELRLLTNFETAEKKLIQIVLAGQPQLEDLLQLPELAQLNQRIGMSCRLLPMNVEETHAYIEKRLTIAGAKYPLFTPEAIQEIFVHTQGIPRVINVLCDLALLFGYADRERQIGLSTIQQASENLNLYVQQGAVVRPVSSSQPRAQAGQLRPQDMPPRSQAGRPRAQEGQHGPSTPAQQFVARPPWQRFLFSRRLVWGIAVVVVALLVGGTVLDMAFNDHKLSKYVAKFMPFALLSSSTTQGAGQPGTLRWAQDSVLYQLPSGEPFSLSLPPLQNAREGFPVEVTLDTLSNAPRWLQFDPIELRLRGIAPGTEAGKIYSLTFRTHTTYDRESVLQLHLAVREQTKSVLSPGLDTSRQK